MNKKQIIIAVVIAAIAVAVLFGFSLCMARWEQAWKDAGVSLTAPQQMAVAASRIVQQAFLLIAFVLVAGSFGVVWLAGLLFQKK
jgi:hypothetical protein